MIYKIVFFLLSILNYVPSASAATYFVSSNGDDTLAGTSVESAWKTIDRVNAAALQPGDRVLFEGGQTFGGSLYIGSTSAGTPTQPIIISSYGPTAATIASGTSCGFYGENTAGIELRRLNFVGDGRLANNNSGVIFYLETPNTQLHYLRLDSLDVSGYYYSGISVGSWQGSSGYSDVRVTNCQTHANGETGFSSYAEDLGAHHDWYIGNCKAYDNAGLAQVTTTNTGSGIIVSGVDGALVENCEAYHNGWLNANPSGGPVGIWGYCCNNLIIQKSESHHNSSGTAHDGGGFDLDGGCTNSILQYNYSHDNGGPGYLLAQYGGAPPMHDLTIRYNVSENDAQRDSQGALHMWSSGSNGGIQRAEIYNNTVLLHAPADGSQPKAVVISGEGFTDLAFRNNVLQTVGGLPIIAVANGTGVRFEGNCYWNSNQVLLDWLGTVYTDLASWRAATGQEQLADGRATGVSADPELPGADPTLLPTADSPVHRAGLNLQAEFDVSPGPQDFIGNPTPRMPEPGNIGAREAETFSAAPLPVVLTEFTAGQVEGAALLRWSTASEQHNAHFVIESSSDGRAFATLGQVLGHGSSTQLHTYRYEDANIARYAAKTVYYRLQQVDTNGKTTYSPVRAVVPTTPLNAAALTLAVYPNPAYFNETVIVNGPAGKLVQLLNARGQFVTSAVFDARGQATFAVARFDPGFYVVRCGRQSVKLTLL
jgi:hypothetical protein